ncbi:hypothetical protein MASR2M15_05090 [Anaerolineales bacterium]
MASLKMMRGPNPNQAFPLEQDKITIGRGVKNHIVIQDNEISREHCFLQKEASEYRILDSGSTNGVFVNGQKINGEGRLLSANCIIELGHSVTFEFQLNADKGTAELDPHEAYLVLTDEQDPTSKEYFRLSHNVVKVGRSLENDIVIQEPAISRFHLKITFQEDGFIAEDLGSSNGSLINGESLREPVTLKSGDKLKIGLHQYFIFTTDTHLITQRSQPSAVTSLLPAMPVGPRREINAINAELPTRGLSTNKKTGVLSLAGTKVMIAYARQDWHGIVSDLTDYLRKQEVDVWVEKEVQETTPDWDTIIPDILTQSYCLLVVLSKDAIKTPYVKQALRYMVSREKPILLLDYERLAHLPLAMANLPRIPFDVFDPDTSFTDIWTEIKKYKVSND